MMKREGGGEYRGEKTYGHTLLTAENIEKLADYASYWAVVIKFDNDDEAPPAHGLFPKTGLVSLLDQGRLSRATLLAGFKTTRSPKRPVPARFFRTLDFLLQYIEAGNSYRPITDKEEAKGFPPAAWCRPPVVAAREEAEAMTAAALAGATPAALARAPPTDPIRLFYACRSWCFIHTFTSSSATSTRMAVGVSAAEVYRMYCDGTLSEYLPMLGLLEEAPPPNTWVPPCVMVPLGALLYMHDHGRPYLPMSLGELREVRNAGVMSLAVRPDARPLRLPPGVWPAADPTAAAALPPGMDLAAGGGGGGGASGSGRGGAGAGGGGGDGSSNGSRHMSRAESLTSVPGAPPPSTSGASAAAGSRQAGGAASAPAPAAATGRGAAAATAPAPASSAGLTPGLTPRSGGGGSNGLAEAAAPRPPEPEPDPILNSSNWIMPQPFDTPIPPPPPEPSDGPAAPGGDMVADGDAAVTAAAAAVVAAAALPSSPFLQCNDGVRPTYESPPLRLFLGERGQSGLSANWWYMDSENKGAIKGPFSPEAMLLSSITHCRELHDATLVCGTEADVRPPVMPPTAAFLPLGDLLRDVMEGSYALVSRVEIFSPLARGFLANRIRQPKPAAPLQTPTPTPATVPVPVVIAVQAQAPPAQVRPQQQQQPVGSAGSGAAAAAGPGTTGAAAAAAAPPPPPPQQATVQQVKAAPPQPQPPQAQVPTTYPVLQSSQPQQQPPPPQAQQQRPVSQPPPQQHPVPQYPPPQPQQQQQQYPQQPQPPPQQQYPQQQQQQASAFVPPSAAVQSAVRGLPLPHLMAARPRPLVTPGAVPVPAFTLPGSMVYMPQYGQAVPYGGQAVMARPVLVNAQMQHAAPAQQMGQQQQQ